MVGMFAKNREEWIILDWANQLYGNTMVPFYDTLGPNVTSFVLGQTNLTTIFCSALQLATLLNAKETFKLKNVVLLDAIPKEQAD